MSHHQTEDEGPAHRHAPLVRADRLDLTAIADRWSREITPPATFAEVFAALLGAYWRGELENGPAPEYPARPERLTLLQSMSSRRQLDGRPLFLAPGEAAPPQITDYPDGGCFVDNRLRIVLPTDPASWTDETADAAMRALAENAEAVVNDGLGSALDAYDDLFKPILAGIEVSREAFHRWASDRGVAIPAFWGKPPASTRADVAVPEIEIGLSELTRDWSAQLKIGEDVLFRWIWTDAMDGRFDRFGKIEIHRQKNQSGEIISSREDQSGVRMLLPNGKFRFVRGADLPRPLTIRPLHFGYSLPPFDFEKLVLLKEAVLAFAARHDLAPPTYWVKPDTLVPTACETAGASARLLIRRQAEHNRYECRLPELRKELPPGERVELSTAVAWLATGRARTRPCIERFQKRIARRMASYGADGPDSSETYVRFGLACNLLLERARAGDLVLMGYRWERRPSRYQQVSKQPEEIPASFLASKASISPQRSSIQRDGSHYPDANLLEYRDVIVWRRQLVKCWPVVAAKQEQSYSQSLAALVQQRRAERAAFAARWRMLYPEAVRRAGPVLFGTDWIGPPNEAEKLALRRGAGHARFADALRREATRSEQIERVTQWLDQLGLVERETGVARVDADEFERRLAEYRDCPSAPWPTVGEVEQGAKAQALPADGQVKMKKLRPKEAVKALIVLNYPDGIPPNVTDKAIARLYEQKYGESVSDRTVARARRGK